MDQKLVDRINALAKKAKAEGLTDAEIAERDALRKRYLKEFRKGFMQVLEHTYVETPDGEKTPLKDAVAAGREEKKGGKEEVDDGAFSAASQEKPC